MGTSAPLAGVTILDAAQGIAGPWCAGLLGLQGARVIKVEPPSGDWGRGIGKTREGMNALTAAVNPGKESVVLDTSDDAGRKALARLAAGADMVIESFRPGVSARIGLDPVALRKANPALVFVSVSGFGAEGPYRNRPGTDTVIQAISGMMQMNRESDGIPRPIPMFAVDMLTGLHAAHLSLAALYRAKATGEGAHVQVPLLDCAASFQAIHMLEEYVTAGAPAVPPTVPSGVFPTADGYLRVTSVSEKTFAAICEALAKTEWLSDPDYATLDARVRNADRLNALVGGIIAGDTTAAWLAKMEPAGVLCAPVNDYDALRADRHAVETGLFQKIEQPGLGPLPIPRPPGTAVPLSPAPRLGADTDAVLADFGFDAEERAALRATKA